MRIFLRTWRYGQDTEVEMHGDDYLYDRDAALLEIIGPVTESGRAVRKFMTVVAGDEFIVENCDLASPCAHPYPLTP